MVTVQGARAKLRTQVTGDIAEQQLPIDPTLAHLGFDLIRNIQLSL